ncbi:MAG: dTDP-4-dehydrorhamnose reductase [Flavobacteriaceae bacterium]
MFNRKKVLVTGSGGQLGRTLQKSCSDKNSFEWIFLPKEKLDITNIYEIKAAFEKYNPCFCINCAALTDVLKSEKEPALAYKVNVEGVKNLTQICNENETSMIHISTDYVFDGKKKRPYIENDKTNPLNTYGMTKYLSEKYVLENLKLGYIVRTSWLYSKNFGRNFYRNILTKASMGNEIKVVKDQYGTPTNTEKVADFIKKIITSLPKKGIYHCAGEEVMSWYDFANKIVKEKNYPNKIIPVKSTSSNVKRPSYSPLKNTEI